MSDKKYSMNQCYHCGNKGLMEVLYEHQEQFGGAIDNEIEEHFCWTLLKCSVCKKVTLIQQYTDESLYDYESGNQGFYIENLYPLNNYRMDNVPDKISSSFEATLKIKNIDLELYMIGLRKVLELICKDKNASGKNLEKKIEDMINKNIFPRKMDTAYMIIRKSGNSAAHDKNLALSIHDVDEITSLLYSIINYLYIIPYKMVDLKKKIKLD